MKHFLVTAAMAVSLASAPVAGMLPMLSPIVYADDWCAVDPLIKVATPQGNVDVHLTVYALGSVHIPALTQETHTTSVAPAPGGKGSVITVNVVIPNDAFGTGFPVRAIISEEPNAMGNILATAQGVSGQVMSLSFTVNG